MNPKSYYECNCGLKFDTFELYKVHEPECIKKHTQSIPIEIQFAGGVSSSKQPAFHLIPTHALIRLAQRFETGIARKGDSAWNALSLNQKCLEDREFLLDRIGHIINHALKLRDKIVRNEIPLAAGEDDDAAAIAWSGIFFCEVTKP